MLERPRKFQGDKKAGTKKTPAVGKLKLQEFSLEDAKSQRTIAPLARR